MGIETLNEDLELVIPMFQEDMDIIAKLDDEPNAVGGLTAAELKAEFDRPGKTIQKYLNEVLVPNLSGTVAEEEVRARNEEHRIENEEKRIESETERNEVVQKLRNMEATTETTPPGTPASVSVEELSDSFLLGFSLPSGIQGPPGASGVYVGSGEMPDGYNVQIDPTGEVWDEDYYDLIFGLNVANTKVFNDTGTQFRDFLWMTNEDVSIEGGSVALVAEKLKKGVPVKVCLREIHFYGEMWWFKGICEATHVSVSNHEKYPDENSPEHIAANFFLTNEPSFGTALAHLRITADIATESIRSSELMEVLRR